MQNTKSETGRQIGENGGRKKKQHNFMQQQGNGEKLTVAAGKQEARDAKNTHTHTHALFNLTSL